MSEDTLSASEQIDQLITSIPDWRGATLAKFRQLILASDPSIIEEWKWMGSPVWSSNGNMIVGNAHKDKVKLTFSHGASLPDPAKLFNNGFNGKVWRAIDLFEGDGIDEAALQELVREAVRFNRGKTKAKVSKPTKPAP